MLAQEKETAINKLNPSDKVPTLYQVEQNI
jgi:hypothetical protein